MRALFSNANFRLHWFSGAIAQTGNFFTVIALPWLVLSITENNPVIMATVLATVALPQALFIIFGGAIVDRISPYKTIILSRISFFLVMASLAALVYITAIPLWLVYVYAFSLGCLGAIGIPAAQSMLPSIVESEHLGYANGIVIGTMYLSQILGPALAGWLMWLGGGSSDVVSSLKGIAFAFAVDAAAMVLALVLFLFIRSTPQKIAEGSVLKLITQGLKYCWMDKGMRLVLAYIVLVSFFIHGPLTAGLPVLAKVKLLLSEAEFGSLYAMTGVGTVVGAGLAMLFKPNVKQLGAVVLLADAMVGACFILLGAANNIYIAALFITLIGVAGGVVMTAGTTWFQQRTPDKYMGRIMSILMFAVLGLIPISATLTGYIIEVSSVSYLMFASGFVVILIALTGLLIPGIRKMGAITPPECYSLG